MQFRNSVVEALVFTVLLGAIAFGQATDSNIVGAVTDPAGQLIPDASITATNRSTGAKYSTTSNKTGQYRFNNIPIGTYDLEATATGMTASKVSGVNLDLNRTASVNFKMALPTVATTIEVVESAAQIDTTTAQLQSVFGVEEALNIPAAGNFVNDTGVLNLSLLAPGVTQSGGVGYGTGPSVGGQRQTNNSFNIDGVDNNRHDVTGPMALVPNDAVQQFSVIENQLSPEFGGASGGVFNTVIKTGTNAVHGSLYEYFANRNLNSEDSKAAVQGLRGTPRFDYNRFGGTIGGPIIKDKLFYFADYEYSPLGQASVPGAPIVAPTAAGYQTIATLPGISTANLGVLRQYLPSAGAASDAITVGGVSVPVGTISVAGPSFFNKQNVVGAVDWNINDNDRVRGRYIYNRYNSIDTNAQLPVFYTTVPDNRYLVAISEFHTFNPTMLNELRISYDHKNNNFPVGNFAFPGLDQFPNLTFDDLGLQLGPDSSTPQGYTQGTAQVTDNVTKTWNHHTLKAGYSFQDIIASNNFIQRARGDYEYSTLDLFLHDLSPDVLGERSVGVSGGIPAGYLFHSIFLNDDYRVRTNFTINLGIRYEYMTVPVVSRYQSFSSLADLPGLITFREPQPQKTNWAPRIGIAWSPGSSGLWAVRAGFGINYDLPYNNLNINDKPPYFQQTEDVPDLTTQTSNFLAGGGLPPSNAISLPTTVAEARAAVSAYTPDQVRPYSINYTLSVEKTFAKDYTFEIRYVGTKGVHLYVQQQLNRVTDVTPTYNIPTFVTQPSAAQLAGLNLTLQDVRNTLVSMTNYPTSPSNAWGQYGFTNTITSYAPVGNSRYNGLSVQLNKRYARNFSYLTSFTWSHAMDDSTATVFSTVLTPRRPADFRNLRADWGTSALDRRLRFTFTPIYDLKMFTRSNWFMKNMVGNWNFSATYTYQSPEYASVQSGIDSNLNNDNLDRSIVNPTGSAKVSSAVNGIDRTGAAVTASTACTVGGAAVTGSGCTVAYVAVNPNARYIQAGAGAYANSGKNTLPLNPIDNIDFQIMKRFGITETKRFEFAAQASNVLNHPQWTGDLLNDVYPNQYNNTRNFLLTGNSSFDRFDQFYTSNPRTVTLVGRFVF